MRKVFLKLVTHGQTIFLDVHIHEETNVFTSHCGEDSHVTEYFSVVCASLGDQYSCEFGSATYYAYCGFGGILSCGLTHTAVVPLDLVKCRIQVNIYSGF